MPVAKKTIIQRRRALKPVLNNLGASEHLETLSRRPNPQKTITRLRVLSELGVPLKGLVFKLSLSNADFEKLVLRHKEKGGLSDGQQQLFDFMKRKKVPERIAMEIARRKNYHSMKIPEKIAFFESIKLDPQKYGVERIPVKYYFHLLTKPFEEIKRGINRQVLWKLEDALSMKKLDKALPNWRNMGTFYKGKGRKKRFIIRPTRILEQILLLIQKGVPLRTDNIVASLEWAQNNPRTRGRRTNSELHRIRKGSVIDITIQRRERVGQISAVEKKIERLNQEIKDLKMTSGKISSTVIIDLEKARDKESEREKLIKERNGLMM